MTIFFPGKIEITFNTSSKVNITGPPEGGRGLQNHLVVRSAEGRSSDLSIFPSSANFDRTTGDDPTGTFPFLQPLWEGGGKGMGRPGRNLWTETRGGSSHLIALWERPDARPPWNHGVTGLGEVLPTSHFNC